MTKKQFPFAFFKYDFDPISQPSKDVVFEAIFVTEPTPELIADLNEREDYVKWIAENAERVTRSTLIWNCVILS